MKDKELERKLKKKIQGLIHDLDSIGPTPLRQLLDAHLVTCYNALATFDQGQYESNEVYAAKCDLIRDQACSQDSTPWR
jgi:hypothetical protein